MLQSVPAGYDRLLVNDALESRVHVFLTRDAGVLSAQAVFSTLGLLIASPTQLLDQLLETGAMHCLLDKRFLYWPMPDQARVSYLIDALPARS